MAGIIMKRTIPKFKISGHRRAAGGRGVSREASAIASNGHVRV